MIRNSFLFAKCNLDYFTDCILLYKLFYTYSCIYNLKVTAFGSLKCFLKVTAFFID